MGRLLIAGLITVGVSVAQTKISLATQSKQVDFTGAASTRPFRAGTALPTSCSQGEVFHVTTAAPGTNLYSCSAANQWVPLSLPSVIGKAGTVLANNGSSIDWVPLAGDISGTPGAETVQGLQGVSVAPVLPSDGQSLVFNSGLNRWQPGSGSSVSSWPVTRSSNTILTVGTGPGIRIGDVYCQVPLNPATVTVGSGTGTIFLFIRSNCELVAASNIVVSSCVQCTSTTGTGYEPDSFPIAKWPVTGGVLDPQGTSALTTYFVRPLRAGQNIQLTYNGGVTQISAPNLTSLHPVRMISQTFDAGGSALVAGTTRYLIVPFSCTLSAWNIVADQGTATVQIWKVPTGTAIPNASNNISGNGLTIGSGTAVHSSNMTGFTNAAVGADDIFGFHLSAVASATFLNTTLECVQ